MRREEVRCIYISDTVLTTERKKERKERQIEERERLTKPNTPLPLSLSPTHTHTHIHTHTHTHIHTHTHTYTHIYTHTMSQTRPHNGTIQHRIVTPMDLTGIIKCASPPPVVRTPSETSRGKRGSIGAHVAWSPRMHSMPASSCDGSTKRGSLKGRSGGKKRNNEEKKEEDERERESQRSEEKERERDKHRPISLYLSNALESKIPEVESFLSRIIPPSLSSPSSSSSPRTPSLSLSGRRTGRTHTRPTKIERERDQFKCSSWSDETMLHKAIQYASIIERSQEREREEREREEREYMKKYEERQKMVRTETLQEASKACLPDNIKPAQAREREKEREREREIEKDKEKKREREKKKKRASETRRRESMKMDTPNIDRSLSLSGTKKPASPPPSLSRPVPPLKKETEMKEDREKKEREREKKRERGRELEVVEFEEVETIQPTAFHVRVEVIPRGVEEEEEEECYEREREKEREEEEREREKESEREEQGEKQHGDTSCAALSPSLFIDLSGTQTNSKQPLSLSPTTPRTYFASPPSPLSLSLCDEVDKEKEGEEEEEEGERERERENDLSLATTPRSSLYHSLILQSSHGAQTTTDDPTYQFLVGGHYNSRKYTQSMKNGHALSLSATKTITYSTQKGKKKGRENERERERERAIKLKKGKKKKRSRTKSLQMKGKPITSSSPLSARTHQRPHTTHTYGPYSARGVGRERERERGKRNGKGKEREREDELTREEIEEAKFELQMRIAKNRNGMARLKPSHKPLIKVCC